MHQCTQFYSILHSNVLEGYSISYSILLMGLMGLQYCVQHTVLECGLTPLICWTPLTSRTTRSISCSIRPAQYCILHGEEEKTGQLAGRVHLQTQTLKTLSCIIASPAYPQSGCCSQSFYFNSTIGRMILLFYLFDIHEMREFS